MKKLLGRAEDHDVIGPPVFVLDACFSVRDWRNRARQRELLREGLGLRNRDRLALLHFQPIGVGMIEPIKSLDVENIGADDRDAFQKSAIEALDGGPHQSYG